MNQISYISSMYNPLKYKTHDINGYNHYLSLSIMSFNGRENNLIYRFFHIKKNNVITI